MAEERIEKQLDIVKILNNLKNLKLLMKDKLKDEKNMFLIENDAKKLISLDTTSEDEIFSVINDEKNSSPSEVIE